MQNEFTSCSEKETIGFGAALAKKLKAGDTLVLKGNLGSGKTVITKGISRGLGVADLREVRSPTFCLCRVYEGRMPIFHVDAFRMEDPEELYDLDFPSEIAAGVLIVEWGERIERELPSAHYTIEISVAGSTERTIMVTPPETS